MSSCCKSPRPRGLAGGWEEWRRGTGCSWWPGGWRPSGTCSGEEPQTTCWSLAFSFLTLDNSTNWPCLQQYAEDGCGLSDPLMKGVVAYSDESDSRAFAHAASSFCYVLPVMHLVSILVQMSFLPYGLWAPWRVDMSVRGCCVQGVTKGKCWVTFLLSGRVNKWIYVVTHLKKWIHIQL